MNSQQLTNRAMGAIVGFAIGDALGMPCQFLSRDQIRHYYQKPVSRFLRAHPGHASDFLAEGSYTDDTQMMLATAECLIECGRMDCAKQGDALLSWFTDSAPSRTPMKANVQACKHLQAGRPWNRSGVFSSDCGAAVRMPPIGIFYHHSTESLSKAALDDCTITHTEPKARAASLAVAYLTARLLQSTDRCSPGEQVLETADRVAYLDADFAGMLRWVTQVVHLPPEEALFEIGTTSDVMEAVPAAVYCFLKHPRNFGGAVLTAVNAGEAADSVGALTGCFVGALTGVESIDEHWRTAVEDSEVLIGVGQNLSAASAKLQGTTAH